MSEFDGELLQTVKVEYDADNEVEVKYEPLDSDLETNDDLDPVLTTSEINAECGIQELVILKCDWGCFTCRNRIEQINEHLNLNICASSNDTMGGAVHTEPLEFIVDPYSVVKIEPEIDHVKPEPRDYDNTDPTTQGTHASGNSEQKQCEVHDFDTRLCGPGCKICKIYLRKLRNHLEVHHLQLQSEPSLDPHLIDLATGSSNDPLPKQSTVHGPLRTVKYTNTHPYVRQIRTVSGKKILKVVLTPEMEMQNASEGRKRKTRTSMRAGYPEEAIAKQPGAFELAVKTSRTNSNRRGHSKNTAIHNGDTRRTGRTDGENSESKSEGKSSNESQEKLDNSESTSNSVIFRCEDVVGSATREERLTEHALSHAGGKSEGTDGIHTEESVEKVPAVLETVAESPEITHFGERPTDVTHTAEILPTMTKPARKQDNTTHTVVKSPKLTGNKLKWRQRTQAGVETAQMTHTVENLTVVIETRTGDADQEGDVKEIDSEDSQSEGSSCTSGDEYLSDLDNLLNEGLSEDLRVTRRVKRDTNEIKRLIPTLGQESKTRDDVESLEEEQIEDTHEMETETVDGVKNIEDEQPKAKTSSSKHEICDYKEIIAVEEKGMNPLETLPNGWIKIRHTSGMPFYLHRSTRVCTWSKPYELRTGSGRKHWIPITAIPCLSYRRALDKEEEGKHESCVLGGDNSRKRKYCDNSLDTSEKIFGNESFNLDPEIDPVTIQECTMSLNALLDIVSSNGVEIEFTCPDISSGTDGSESHDLNSSLNDIPLNGTTMFNHSILNSPGKRIATTCPRIRGSSQTLKNKNILPCARVETARENNTLNSVQPLKFRAYCQKLFKFKHLKSMRFKTWSARRRHNKEQKRLELQRPTLTLPDGVKLITFSAQIPGDSDGGKGNKEYIINTQGKSSVCILHQYLQHVLRIQPTYVFEELENAATPYLATVQINGVSYAVGFGSSKKQAKAAAAKATLELMIPEMKEELNGSKDAQNLESDQCRIFDQVRLDDPRITKMCANISEPSPYALLLTCVQRNFGQSASSSIKFNMVSSGKQSNRFRMKTGEFAVEVTAANKREGKQLASQALLAAIHPQIKNFGALLGLYGNGSIKSVKEKKQEEQQITTLQSKATCNSPNYALLTKLREEMKKLRAEEEMKASLPEDKINSGASLS